MIAGMRMSASVCPAAEVPFSYCGRLERTVPSLHRMGYDGIEILLRRVEEIEVRRLRELLSKYDMKASAIGTGLAVRDGLTLSSRDEKIRSKAVRRVLEFSKLAEDLDCHVILGSIKGGVFPEPSLKSLEKSSRQLRDIYAVIEPLNRYESAIISTASEAMNLIRRLDLDRFGILLDTFHMNIEEKDPVDTIKKVGKMLQHFHIADSNRRAPGDGHIRFGRIFGELKNIQYDGFISAEILQEPTSEAALRKTVRFVRTMKRTGEPIVRGIQLA